MIKNCTKGFSIGDVSRICKVPSHTIRYWEKEFDQYLNPGRTPGGQRRFSDHDVRKLLEIKRLLWTEKFTVQGARRLLAGDSFLALLGDSAPVSPETVLLRSVA